MLMRRRGRDPNKPAPGIRRRGSGWQTRVKVRGEESWEQWPLDTPLSELLDWIKDEKARLRTTLPKVQAGTFAADARKYLARPDVHALPTFDERTQHINEWVAVFGPRRRRKITPDLIAAQRDRWLADTDDGRYAPASVNKRLRALSNLWTLLDGRRAPNPVLEVAECEEPDPEARGLPYEVIEAILAAIPDTAIGRKKDGTRTTGKNIPRPSKTKARLRVIAYTGLAHAQLKQLDREDVDLETGTIRLVARRKGRKLRRAQDRPIPQLLPLLPQAIEAFKTFDRLGCWGPFSNSSMWKAFSRACKTLKITGLRPYDFRHSFATAVYAETRDLRVTGKFVGHRSERTTKRYTIAAVAPHVQAALTRVGERLAVHRPVHHGTRTDADHSENLQAGEPAEGDGLPKESP
jgi:integrase